MPEQRRHSIRRRRRTKIDAAPAVSEFINIKWMYSIILLLLYFMLKIHEQRKLCCHELRRATHQHLQPSPSPLPFLVQASTQNNEKPAAAVRRSSLQHYFWLVTFSLACKPWCDGSDPPAHSSKTRIVWSLHLIQVNFRVRNMVKRNRYPGARTLFYPPLSWPLCLGCSLFISKMHSPIECTMMNISREGKRRKKAATSNGNERIANDDKKKLFVARRKRRKWSRRSSCRKTNKKRTENEEKAKKTLYLNYVWRTHRTPNKTLFAFSWREKCKSTTITQKSARRPTCQIKTVGGKTRDSHI